MPRRKVVAAMELVGATLWGRRRRDGGRQRSTRVWWCSGCGESTCGYGAPTRPNQPATIGATRRGLERRAWRGSNTGRNGDNDAGHRGSRTTAARRGSSAERSEDNDAHGGDCGDTAREAALASRRMLDERPALVLRGMYSSTSFPVSSRQVPP